MSKQTATANMSLPDLPDLLLSLICSRLDGCSLHAIHSLHSGLRKCALDHVQGLSVVLTSDLHTVVEQARAKFTELRRGKPLPLTICSGDSRPAGLHGPGGWHDSALDLFLEWSMLSSALFTLITPLRLSGLDLGDFPHTALQQWISCSQLSHLELFHCTFHGPMLHQLSELECLTHLSITLTDPEPEHTMPEQPNAGNQGDDSDEEEDQVQEVQPEDSSTDKTGLVTAGLGALGHLRSLEINGPRTRPNSELCEEIAQLKGLTSLSLNMRGPFTGPGEVNWWYTGGDISPILEECSNLKRLQISSLARDGLDSILQTSQGLEQLIVSQTCQSTTNLQNRIHSLRSLQIGDVQLGSVCKQSGKMLAHMPLHDLQEPLQIGTLRVRVPNSEDVHYIQAEAQLTRIKAEARALADHYKATRAGKVLRVAPTMLAHYPVCVSARDYSAADLAAALAPLAPYVSVLALNEMHDDVARGAAIVQALGSDAHYVGLRVPQLGNLQGTLASLCPGTQELYVFGMGQQQQPQQQHVSGASSRTEASCASPDFGRTDMSVSGAGAGAVPPAAGATGLVAPAALQATDSPMLGLGADAGAAGSSDGLQASAAGMDVDATPVTASAAAAPQPFRLAPGEHPLTSHPLTSLTNTPSSHPLAPELTQSPPQSEASPTAAAPAAAPGASGSNDPTTSLTLDQLCTTSTPVSPWYSPAPPSFPGPTAAPGSAPAARSAPAPAAWSNQAPTGPLATVQPITTQPALTQHPAECATTSSPVSTPSAPAAPQPHLDSPGNAQILAKVCASLPHLKCVHVDLAWKEGEDGTRRMAREHIRAALHACGLSHVNVHFM